MAQGEEGNINFNNTITVPQLSGLADQPTAAAWD